jgi:hypothetical protein
MEGSKKVTRLNLRHTRREGRAWFTAPDLEQGMNEAIEECRDAGGAKPLPRIWLIPRLFSRHHVHRKSGCVEEKKRKVAGAGGKELETCGAGQGEG